MSALTYFSPAKINLFLAVTGQRADGFHELLSVIAPLEWGDTLSVESADQFSLTCDDPAVPCDETNLVLKAARAFQAATGWRGGARFSLQKRIPIGAGLGGGSSNAATAFRALNTLSGELLPPKALAELAAIVGSDCALFLHGEPLVMRGRGERIEELSASAVQRLSGRSVLVFKPAFGISTAWAYGAMAAEKPRYYLSSEQAEAQLARWLGDSAAAADTLLFNNMESIAFRKFPALPGLLEKLTRTFGLAVRMSGSGSACFALLPARAPVDQIRRVIRESWGESAFLVQSRIT